MQTTRPYRRFSTVPASPAMSTPDFHYLQYTTSVPTITSGSSPALEYDVEATQMKGDSGMLTPSLERKDIEVFQFHIEKGSSEMQATVRGGMPRSNQVSLLASEASGMLPPEDLQKKESEGNVLKIIFQIFFALVVLGILWTPAILAWVEFPEATILGVRLLRWSIWFTVVWAGICIMIAVLYITSSTLKSTSKIVLLRRSRHLQEVRDAHMYLWTIFLMIVNWVSYQPLIIRSVPPNNPAENTAMINILGTVLLGILICAVFLALAKYSLQKISENFHERSYGKRVQNLEKIIQALCILYKNTVDVAVRSDVRHSELILDPNLHFGRHGGNDGKQLKGRDRERVKSEIAGYSALQGQAPEPFMRIALSTPTKSRLLAKRIFYSFSRPGTNWIRADDVAAFFLTPEDAAGAFALFDKEGNGDVSREEIEATCLEFHREQVAIEDSMRNSDAALSQLDGIMMAGAYVACSVVFAVIMNPQFTPIVTGIGVLILGLSWLVGGSVQEVVTSIIFLFAKHPFDVGDSIVIKDERFRVKKMKLLSTVFLDTNSTLVQVSNHQLNNLFIYNLSRSSHLSETFMFDVHYSTTFQEVEKIREKMLEFVKSESRDFQPVFDVVVKDFPGQSKMVLSADIKYRSNVAGLKDKRRNKWLCALKCTLAGLGPTGEPHIQRCSKGPSEVVENDLDRDSTFALAC